MSQAVKRACDACHRRKVKCDGVNPCRNCSSAQLSCTYNAIPQKKGPKGSRAKVISELRETQRQTSLFAKVQNRMNGVPCSSAGSGLGPTPGLLTSDVVKECVQFFFDNMYGQIPILDQRQIDQQILYMEQNRDAYCLLTALCAFTMIQPGMSMPPGDPYNLDMVPGANIISSQLLLEEALRVRKGYEYLDSITFNTLATNFFLFGCFYGQEMHDRAWYYLREATTMIHMIGMHKEEHYLQFDAAEASRRRRLYWLFYLIEKAYAVQRQRPTTLEASISLPTLNDDPTDPLAHQINGFVLLVNIYRPFDDAFIANWTKTRGQLSPQYISNLQKQLNDLAQSYGCQDPSFQDFGTNQQWLKNTVWQLTNGGANGNHDESISFPYPLEMARDLLMNMASQFPGQGMELMGSGLIEKLIQTVYSMSDYLSIQPASRDPFAVGPREHLNQILTIVAMSRHGDNRFLPLLMNKITEVLPRLANPMLQNAPENSDLASIDIFDGFGNAGMAQPAPMQMQMDHDYDRKFPAEDYEKKFNVDVHNTTPESVNNSNSANNTSPMTQQTGEMNGSFVSSPGMMSPGIEYSHNINGFSVTPMSEMVMSPLGSQSQSGHMSTTQSSQQHQHPHQHQQHLQSVNHGQDSIGQRQSSQHHMNGMNAPNIRNPSISSSSMTNAHGLNSIGGMRQLPQRQSSFQFQSKTPMSSVGDFRGLQRINSDVSNPMVGINSLSTEMDFSAL